MAEIDPQAEVSTRRARRWMWPAAALLAVWCGLFVVWPNVTARHVVRALVPGSTLGTAAGRIIVAPGSVELIEGDTLEVTARHSADPRTRARVGPLLPDEASTAMPMEPRDNGSFCQLGRADRSFEYEVRAGARNQRPLPSHRVAAAPS